MCNCNSIQPCTKCQQQLPCSCPPVYPVPFSTVPCNCCPPGFTFSGTSNTYPNGFCTQNIQPFATVATIPCVSCDEVIATDCVTFQCTTTTKSDASNVNLCAPCADVANGDTLTTIIQKICPTNPAVILQMLQVIAADTTYGLKNAFCEIVNFCSFVPGSLTPYIGPISFTIP